MELKCVYASDNEVEALEAKELLESNGIATLVKNLHTQNLFSDTKLFTGADSASGMVEIHVDSGSLEQARRILMEGLHAGNETGRKTPFDREAFRLQRNVFLGLFFAIASWLIIPYFINFFFLLPIYKKKRTAFWMMLLLGTILFTVGVMAALSNLRF